MSDPTRTPILAANWKMNKTLPDATAFAEKLLPLLRDVDDREVVIAPPSPLLSGLRDCLQGSRVQLAGQNVHPEPSGAFTGEISAEMLSEVGCSYAIVGHSERRHIFGETSAFVAGKVAAALGAGLRPILCVGETREEREAERTFEVVGAQLDESIPADLDLSRIEEIVVAYEPVWAIGTGLTATPEIAQEVHAFIRERLARRYPRAAEGVRIQYGGSARPDNVRSLLAQPDIDGALVGGASLDPNAFAAIVLYDR